MSMIISIIRAIRFVDAMVFLGPPVLGIMISIHSTNNLSIDWWQLWSYILVIYIMAIHVFLLNDLCDSTADREDPYKKKYKINERSLSSKNLTISIIITAIIPLFLILLYSFWSFIIGSVLLSLSALYSSSIFKIPGKVIPWISSLLHLIGGTLSFILGYLLIGNMDKIALIAGLMFGFFITAGHSFQEIQDNDGDKLNKVNTLTVRKGVHLSAVLGLIYITIGHLLTWLLIYFNTIPASLLVNASVFITILIMILVTFKKGLDYENMRWLRNRYRIVYAIFWLIVSFKILYPNTLILPI